MPDNEISNLLTLIGSKYSIFEYPGSASGSYGLISLAIGLPSAMIVSTASSVKPSAGGYTAIAVKDVFSLNVKLSGAVPSFTCVYSSGSIKVIPFTPDGVSVGAIPGPITRTVPSSLNRMRSMAVCLSPLG